MKVYFVQDEDNFVRGVFSTFAIAKAAARKTLVNDFIERHGDIFEEEELEEIMKEFETTGNIDEVCHIEEYIVDETIQSQGS